VQLFEQQAAALIEDSLPIPQIARNLNRADLATGDARIAGILGKAQPALDAAGDRSADVAGNALDLRIVKPIHHDPIVGTQPPKSGADLACRTALRPAPDPHRKGEHQ